MQSHCKRFFLKIINKKILKGKNLIKKKFLEKDQQFCVISF